MVRPSRLPAARLHSCRLSGKEEVGSAFLAYSSGDRSQATKRFGVQFFDGPRRRKAARYSITSSARTSRDEGTVMPSAFAVLILIASNNLLGNSTGKSPGAVPCRILSTK
jgi:hypothetical protein